MNLWITLRYWPPIEWKNNINKISLKKYFIDFLRDAEQAEIEFRFVTVVVKQIIQSSFLMISPLQVLTDE